MEHFPHRKEWGTAGDAIEKVNSATDWLLRRAGSESGEGRRRAIARLIHVYHAELMTADQEGQFGELLWNKRTASNLPDAPNFAVFGFLHLPAPASVDVPSIVKNYILSLSSTGSVSRDANGKQVIAFKAAEQPLIF